MKLEYRVLEVAKDSRESCDHCLLDFRASSFTFTSATHEIVARNKEGECVDISFVCANCKEDLEKGTLPYCEECGRLKKHREACFCSHLKDKKLHQPVSENTLIARSFSSRLENKTRELEKELSTAKEELEIEREEITKFHEKSKEWSKKQKQELLGRVKELEAENVRLILENKKLKEQQNGQTAQIEIKEPKKWPWKLKK